MTESDGRTARRVLIVIGLVLATLLGLLLLYAIRRVLLLLAIAAFLAVALNPAVDWVQRKLTWCRRAIATLLVFLAAFGLIAGMVTAIVLPLVRQLGRLADRLPQLANEARAGRGPIGGLLERLHLREYLQSHEGEIRTYAADAAGSGVSLLVGVVTTVAGTITVLVLAYLIVLQAPRITAGGIPLVPDRYEGRVRRIGRGCARAITGYVSGNLLISLICGTLTFAVLAILRVPYAGVVALLVAIADLIPLVGATLGAAFAVGTAFARSAVAALVVLVFFVVYQQVENHVLQPLILSRTVRLSPLTVLFSILVGVELAGIVGALLAIPVAGMVQVVLQDLRNGRHDSRESADRAPPVPDAP